MPCAGGRADLEPAAEPLGALLHRRQPEPARAQIPAPAGSKPTPSSSTSSSRPCRRARSAHRDVAARRRAGPRSAAPPGRCGAPRGRAPDRRGASPSIVELDLDAPRGAARSSTCLRSAPASPSRSRSGGRSSKTSERSSSSASCASACSRSTCSRAAAGSRSSSVAGRLGAQDEAEQLLADGVVELEREAVALGDDRELAALLVQAGVRDRDRRVRGEQLDQLVVRRR